MSHQPQHNPQQPHQHQIVYFPSIGPSPLPPQSTASVLPTSSSSIKPPKPPAQCSYCGMTFKKLEHCQRHERTHTLDRPYSCTVCYKTFARQDTLNRHLRLHSRPDDGTAPRPKKRPSKPSVSVSTSSGPELFPPISTTTLLNPQLAQASDQAHDRTRPGRERGFSLSAVDQHSTLDPYSIPILSAQQRQSISLPPHWSQYPQLINPSDLFGPPTHQHWNTTHPPVSDPIPPELTLNSSPLLNNLSLGPLTPLDSSLLAGLNAYTLIDVSASDNPPPMSAPATCTSWSGLPNTLEQWPTPTTTTEIDSWPDSIFINHDHHTTHTEDWLAPLGENLYGPSRGRTRSASQPTSYIMSLPLHYPTTQSTTTTQDNQPGRSDR